MKRKYYLRGIGVGILFTALIWMTTVLISGNRRMTDEEILARAQELGMVKQESVLEHLDKPSDTQSEDINTNEKDTTEDDTAQVTENHSEEATDETTEATTEEATEPAETIVTFTIVSGMNSWNVATMLQDQGVVDASEFDGYLEANGYSSRIVTGEYSVAIGTDYETIAKMITGR